MRWKIKFSVPKKRYEDFLRTCKRYCKYVNLLKREKPLFEVEHVIKKGDVTFEFYAMRIILSYALLVE
jgi:hypothetical protein